MSQSTNLSQVNTVATAPARSGSQIPDLLRIGAIPSDTSMDVLTDILDPVVHNDNYVRFAFQNKGILHSMSKIQFALDTVSHNSVLPLSTGIYSNIARIRFSIGSRTVCEIEDFNKFMGYKGLFISQEAMKEREQFTTSRIMNYGFQYTDQRDDAVAAADDKYMFGWAASNPNGDSAAVPGLNTPGNTEAKFLNIDNGIDAGVPTHQDGASAGGIVQFLNKPATGGAGVTDGDGRPLLKAGFWADLNRDDADTTPTWQVSIADLVPFLRTQQLPLYMLDELVTLEIFFTAPSQRVYAPGHVAATANIKQSETRMIADYIFYPQEMMVAYANANRNLSFNYVDYRLSKYSLDDGTVDHQIPTSLLIRNIGGAGRVITRIFFGIEDLNETTSAPLGAQNAAAPLRDYTAGRAIGSVNGVATINLKYNDTFVYPIDVNNNARHFHNVAVAEGITPMAITREAYSMEGESITTASYQCATTSGTYVGPPALVNLSTGLGGKQFYAGIRLNDGQRINSRGIELYLTWSNSLAHNAGKGYVQRVWLETLRTLTLQNGRVSIQWT